MTDEHLHSGALNIDAARLAADDEPASARRGWHESGELARDAARVWAETMGDRLAREAGDEPEPKPKRNSCFIV